MKNKRILLFTTICLLAISACSKNDDTNSSTNSNNYSSLLTSTNSSTTSSNEFISGVEIAGPISVLVGKSIRLTADVLGSNNDDVLWSSSDTNIATISNEGTLKGISEGSATITATSIKDPNYFGTYTVNVTLPKANSLSLFIEDNENVSYDATNDIYQVYLGQTFYIDISFLPIDSKSPDITYSISYPTGSKDNMVTIDIVPNTTRAKVISYATYDGLVITANGNYNDLATAGLKASIEIDVVDKNIDEYTEINNIVNSFKTSEVNQLVSSKINRTKTSTKKDDDTKENIVTKTIENIDHYSYLNSSYVNKNIKNYINGNLDNELNKYYYQGKNTLNSQDFYYTFEYDNNKNIVEIFNHTNNDEEIGLMFDVHSSITYGYYNILNNILSSETNLYEGDIASFGNTYIYAYADFEINNNNFKITSNCFDEDYDINYNLSLEVYHTQNRLTGYSFKETIDYGTSTIVFEETGSDFVYSDKVNDSNENPNYIDLNKYYIDEFEIIQFNEKEEGKYDYTNLDKYGSIKTEENGLTKYVASYDKTIILKANVLSPSTANVNIDNIKAISSDTTQVPNTTSFADGIFAFNACKDDNSNSLPGKATITFTSTKGVQQQIIIEFVEAALNSVSVDMLNNTTYDKDNNLYIMEKIYENAFSDYFFINTDPDEDKYKFNIEILSGNQNGIELIKHEKNNELGYPEFSYSIKGNIKGTYQFKIYVIGHEYIECEEVFEIEVKEVLKKEFIIQNIVGQTYEYQGSTTTYSFTFASETKLDYKETFLDEVKETSFNYHIEDGAIIVDETQNFLEGMYFSRLGAGKILFAEDFSSITPYIEYANENKFTYYFEFKHVFNIDTIDSLSSYISNKSFTNRDGNLIVQFNNGNGVLIYKDYGGNVLATFTFQYVLNDDTKVFTILDSTSSTTNYELIESACEFDSANLEFIFRIQTNGKYPFYDDYKISLI